jgi:hypothetical protein
VDNQANAYGNRDANFILHMLGMVFTPEVGQALKQVTEQFKADLAEHLTGGVYINFLEGEEKWTRTKDALSPETYRKMMSLKAQHDPQNRFRYSFNIPPVKG